MAEKLLSITKLRDRVPFAPSRIYELLLGEEDFPRPLKIGRRNFWREAEVDAWIERLAAQRDSAAPGAPRQQLVPAGRRKDLGDGASPARCKPSEPRPLTPKEIKKINAAGETCS